MSYSWSLISGTASAVTISNSNSQTATASFNDDGSAGFMFELEVDDGITTATDTVYIQVSEISPSNVNAGGPYSADEDNPSVSVSGSASKVNCDTLEYKWEWGYEGQNTGWGLSNDQTSHTFPSDTNTYTITFKVKDDDGNVVSDTATVNINNVDPSNPSITVNDGSATESSPTVDFDGSASSGNHDSLEYRWYYGDGTSWTSWSSTNDPSHTYPGDKASYTVKMRVRDEEGTSYDGEATNTVNIQNTLVSGSINTVSSSYGTGTTHYADEQITFTLTGISDPGESASDITCEWDWSYDGSTFNSESTTSGNQNAYHTYQSTGTYQVMLHIIDPDDSTLYASDDIVLSIINDAPTIGDLNIEREGSTVNNGDEVYIGDVLDLSLSVSDSNHEYPSDFTHNWELIKHTAAGDVITQDAFSDSTSATPTLTFDKNHLDNGFNQISYSIRATITDGCGSSDTYTKTLNLTNRNSVISNFQVNGAPVSDGEQITVHIGEVDFYAQFTDQDRDLINYDLMFGDGQKEGTDISTPGHIYNLSTSHTYQFDEETTNGSTQWELFYVNLWVNDTHTGSVTYQIVLNVTNEIPTADANGPYYGDEGENIQFYSGSSDPDNDDIFFYWTFGDGGSSTDENPIHYYSDNGTYNVTLNVTDGHGNYSLDYTFVVVNDTDPNPVISYSWSSPGQYPNERETVIFDAGSSTPGSPTDTIQNYTWNLGDGTIKYGTTVTHIYDSGGSYIVNLTLHDEDSYNHTIETVLVNTIPTANIDSPVNYSEHHVGTVVDFSASVNDTDTSSWDTLTYTWNFGDGTIEVYSENESISNWAGYPIEANFVQHIYDISITNHTFTVTLTVEDSNQAVVIREVTIYLTNDIPAAQITDVMDSEGSVLEDEGIAFAHLGDRLLFDASGSNDLDNLYYKWDFGDGNISTSSQDNFEIEHTYLEKGIYTVILTVTDEYTLYNTSLIEVRVNNEAPTINDILINGKEIKNNSDISVDPGDVNFEIEVSEIDGDEYEYYWYFGDGDNTTWLSPSTTAVHNYSVSGDYSVRVIVRDEFGESSVREFKLKINKHTPVADAGADRVVYMYEVIQFNGDSTYDLDGDALTYKWDFDSDGKIDGYGVDPTYRFTEEGLYTVNLTVIDADGRSDYDTSVIDVSRRLEIPSVEVENSILVTNDITVDGEYNLIIYNGSVNILVDIVNYAESNTETFVSIYDTWNLEQYIAWNDTLNVAGNNTTTHNIDLSLGFGFHTISVYVRGPKGNIEDEETILLKVIGHTTKPMIFTSPNLADSDGDGLWDGNDVYDSNGFHVGERNSTELSNPSLSDSDHDGLTDYFERMKDVAVNVEGVQNLDPLNSDIDGDMIPDGQELLYTGTSPFREDTDRDGIPDWKEVKVVFRTNAFDMNGDGLYEYTMDTWISVDTGDDGFLEKFEFEGYSENIIGKKLTIYTPDGFGIYYDNITDCLLIKARAENGTYPQYAPSTDTYIVDDAELVYSFAIKRQESYNSGNSNIIDTDGDGIPDNKDPAPNDVDFDDDGLWDGFNIVVDGVLHHGELTYGCSPSNNDSDSDNLLDGDEVEIYGTDPMNADTDNDGLLDSSDSNPGSSDNDNDTLSDGWELDHGLNPSDPTDAYTDSDSDGATALQEFNNGTYPDDPDCDNDGINDGWEIRFNLNPWNEYDALWDMDGDGLNNLEEFDIFENNTYSHKMFIDPYLWDSDNDGMPDGWEHENRLDPTIANAIEDADNDSVINLQEYIYNLDPHNSDSDGDGMNDSIEIKYQLETHFNDSAKDLDGDGLTNIEEVQIGLNMTNPDSDGDGMLDKWEVDNDLNPIVDDANLNKDGDYFDKNHDGVIDSDEVFTNFEEYLHRTDPNSTDTDGDGMSDPWEVFYNLNPHRDDSHLDLDNDGLINLVEYEIYYDTGNTGHSGNYNNLVLMNVRNADSDGDGISDGWEYQNGMDPTNPSDALDNFDADNLTNLEEFIYNTDPNNPDSDLDGIYDCWEISNRMDPNDDTDADIDFDNDGLTNIEEYQIDMDIGYSHVYPMNPWFQDSDFDGMDDGWEDSYGLDPTAPSDANSNLDTDSLSNYEEYVHNTYPDDPDSDGDGMDDGWEVHWFILNPRDDTDVDSDPDGDGLTNLDEYNIHTNPNYSHAADMNPVYWDSDFDGMPDGWEYEQGLRAISLSPCLLFDPTDPSDSKEDVDLPSPDGLTNFMEYWHHTDPLDNDTDDDGLTDGYEIEVGTCPIFYDSHWDIDLDGLNFTQELMYGTNATDPDTDGDGLTDGWEVFNNPNNPSEGQILDPTLNDTDGNSIKDGLEDFDNDQINNLEEFIWGTNPMNSDTDSDNLPDIYEINFYHLTDGLHPTIPDSNLDVDGDGKTSLQEYTYGTDPTNEDTDGDRIPDGWEIDHDDIVDPFVKDSDDDPDEDGLINFWEWHQNGEPDNPDTDGDGMPDGWEHEHLLSLGVDDSGEDPDGDGLTNIEEYQKKKIVNWEEISWDEHTNPFDDDSDNDGIKDGHELTYYYPYSKEYAWNWKIAYGDIIPGADYTEVSPSTSVIYKLPLFKNEDIGKSYKLYIYSPSDTDINVKVAGSTFDVTKRGFGWDSVAFNITSSQLDGMDISINITNADVKTLLLLNLVLERQGGLDPVNVDSDDDGVYDGDEVPWHDDDHLTFPANPDTDSDMLSDGYEIDNGLDPNPVYSTRINTQLLLPYDPSATESENDGTAEKTISKAPEENYLVLLIFVDGDPKDAVENAKGEPMLEAGFNEIIIPFSVLFFTELYDKDSTSHLTGLPDESDTGYYDKTTDYTTKKLAHVSFAMGADDAEDLMDKITQDESNLQVAKSIDVTYELNAIFNKPTMPKLTQVLAAVTPYKEKMDTEKSKEVLETLRGDLESIHGFVEMTNNGESLKIDDDGDGLNKWSESSYGLTEGVADEDGDGLKDGEEVFVYHLDPLNVDTDNDGLYDGDELKPNVLKFDSVNNPNNYVSDPTLFDTDGDQLSDKEELITDAAEDNHYVTNPGLADTDGDGLMDGKEEYEFSYKIYQRYKIPDSGIESRGQTISVPSHVKSVIVKAGMNHTRPQYLNVSINGEYIDNPYYNETSGALENTNNENQSLYVTKELDLSPGSPTISLEVEDISSDGHYGYIEQFTVTIKGYTDPRYPDSENGGTGDGISDYEEVNLGADGWITDPWSADTDGDGLDDGEEVAGSQHGGITSDPTRADTDMDSIGDKEDIDPQHDLLLQVHIYHVKTNSEFSGDKVQEKIKIVGGNWDDSFTSTPKRQGDSDFFVTVDIDDSLATTYDIGFDCWQNDAGALDTDGDTHLGSGFDWTSYGLLTTDGELNSTKKDKAFVERYKSKITGGEDHYWADMRYEIKITHMKYSKTWLINPKDDETSKLYETENGELRYTGEERFYLFSLSVNDNRIVNIIVPESVYYDSKLGHALLREDLSSLPSSLESIEFGGLNSSENEVSYSIRGVLTATVTSTQASLIIEYLTKNKTGATPYKKEDITSSITQMHLPKDVLFNLPISMPKQSELGKIAEGFVASSAEALTEFGGMVWNVVLAGAEFLNSMAEKALEIGMKVLGALKDAASKIASAVVEALSIMVEWIKGLVKQTVSTVFKPMIDFIHNWIYELVLSINTLLYLLGVTTDQSNSNNLLLQAVGSDEPRNNNTVDHIIESITEIGQAVKYILNVFAKGMILFSIFFGLSIALTAIIMIIQGTGVGAGLMQVIPKIITTVVLGLIVDKLLGNVISDAIGWIAEQMTSEAGIAANVIGASTTLLTALLATCMGRSQRLVYGNAQYMAPGERMADYSKVAAPQAAFAWACFAFVITFGLGMVDLLNDYPPIGVILSTFGVIIASISVKKAFSARVDISLGKISKILSIVALTSSVTAFGASLYNYLEE